MKIAIAQLDYHIGNFEGNLDKMLRAVDEARAEGADLIVFGELAVCGYPPRDFLEFDDFIRRSQASVDALRHASRGIAIVVGSPSKNPRIEGKDLYNSAYFLYNGEVLGVQNKTLLPTYDIFDEYRYFEPAHEWKTIEYKGVRFALVVCEDIWNAGNENPMYAVSPLDEMQDPGFDVILNVSASPFDFDHARLRINTVRHNVLHYKAPMFYSNCVGAQTDVIFDGGSLVVSPDGQVFDEMPYFVEDLRYYDLDAVMSGGQQNEQPKDKIKLIHDALLLGIRDYFRKLGFKSAILGLSGGIDSAVTAVLAARALGPDNVRGVLMPSQHSSQHSVADARQLALNLGIQYDLIPIEPMYAAFEKALEPHFWGVAPNITEENIQARVRGILLMSLSNKFGHILLNTTNKSEMAVGYGTLYGDLCGGLAVLADVYKTEVYELAAYLNATSYNGVREGAIPQNSITKPPSAELRPGQKDSDSLPPYDLLDPLLFQYIEKRQGPRELIAKGFDEALVARVCRMVNVNEFKREQAPPVIRVSSKGFGMGRRLPIVGKYLS
jgi:NAD+ synthase (glutamine-hydrolysing)